MPLSEEPSESKKLFTHHFSLFTIHFSLFIMNDSLLSAIKALDFTAIRNICLALSQEERQELKSYFARKNFNFIFREVLKEEKRYHFSNKELAIISYTIMCVCNTFRGSKKNRTFPKYRTLYKGELLLFPIFFRRRSFIRFRSNATRGLYDRRYQADV